MRDEVGQNKDASSRFHRLTAFFIFSGYIYMNSYHNFESNEMPSGKAYDT